jgi:hypothetical protein
MKMQTARRAHAEARAHYGKLDRESTKKRIIQENHACFGANMPLHTPRFDQSSLWLEAMIGRKTGAQFF